MMDLRELTNETTKFLRPLQAEVSLNTRNKRKARRTEIPNDVPGTRIPNICLEKFIRFMVTQLSRRKTSKILLINFS